MWVRGVMPSRRVLAFVTGLLVLMVPATASAWKRPSAGAAKPYFDSRASTRAAVQRGAQSLAATHVSAATVRARSTERSAREQLGARAIVRRSAQRHAAAASASTARSPARPRAIAPPWRSAGCAPTGQPSASRRRRRRLDPVRRVDPATGSPTCATASRYRGIPAFDGGLRVNLDRGGRILNVTGSPCRTVLARSDAGVSSGDATRAAAQTSALPARSSTAPARRASAARRVSRAATSPGWCCSAARRRRGWPGT